MKYSVKNDVYGIDEFDDSSLMTSKTLWFRAEPEKWSLITVLQVEIVRSKTVHDGYVAFDSGDIKWVLNLFEKGE